MVLLQQVVFVVHSDSSVVKVFVKDDLHFAQAREVYILLRLSMN